MALKRMHDEFESISNHQKRFKMYHHPIKPNPIQPFFNPSSHRKPTTKRKQSESSSAEDEFEDEMRLGRKPPQKRLRTEFESLNLEEIEMRDLTDLIDITKESQPG
jgi:hypothetical protein